MATYSAGRLNISGNLTVASGTASSVNASTITATTINATTINPTNLGITGLQTLSLGGGLTSQGQIVSATQFQPASGSRQVATCGGITLNNDRYLPAVANVGRTYAKDCKSLSAACANSMPMFAMEPTNGGVCDQDFVYYSYEIGEFANSSVNRQGTAWYQAWGWTGTAELASTTCIVVKQSRVTGQVVMAVPLGSIANQALTAGPTVMYSDGVMRPEYRDGSGEVVRSYDTSGVLWPTNYTSYDISTYVGNGDDCSRGPWSVYTDPNGVSYIYVNGMGTKYNSIMKIRCSDMTLMWRWVSTHTSQYISIPGRPDVSISGSIVRTSLVVPPALDGSGALVGGRTTPLVLAGLTTGTAYASIDYVDLLKMWNYYTNCGSVWGINEQEYWGPKTMLIGKIDPSRDWTMFTGAGYAFYDSSGVLQNSSYLGDSLIGNGKPTVNQFPVDTSGVQSSTVKILYPLTTGYTFETLKANGDSTASDSSGNLLQTLITSRQNPTGVTVINGVSVATNYGSVSFAKFWFPDKDNIANPPTYVDGSGVSRSYPANYYGDSSGVNTFFGDSAHYYTGVLQVGTGFGTGHDVSGNATPLGSAAEALVSLPSTPAYPAIGPGAGTVTIRGDLLMQNYTTVASLNAANAGTLANQFMSAQPVVKVLNINQCYDSSSYTFDKKIDQFESYGLSNYGGGVYGNIMYEPTKDCIVLGTGQGMQMTWQTLSDFYTELNKNNNFPTRYVAENPVANGFTNYANLLKATYSAPKATLYTRPVNGSIIAAATLQNPNPFSIYNTDSNNNPMSSLPTTGYIYKIRAMQNTYWNRFAQLRQTVQSSATNNRAMFCSFVGIKCSAGGGKAAGELLFAAKVSTADVIEWSSGFRDLGSQTGVWMPNGGNTDCTAGCTMYYPNVQQKAFDTSGGILNRPYMIAANKSRILIFDYNALFEKLTHVAGSSAVDYIDGIATNSVMKYTTAGGALVWEEMNQGDNAVHLFNGQAFDGKYLIKRKSATSKIIHGYEPGLDINGICIDANGTNLAAIECYNIPSILLNPPKTDAVSGPFANWYGTNSWTDASGVIRRDVYFDGSNNFIGIAGQGYQPWLMTYGTDVGFRVNTGMVQIYGDVVISGSNSGQIFFNRISDGKLLYTINAPNGCLPLCVDGNLYGFGGFNRFPPLPQRYPECFGADAGKIIPGSPGIDASGNINSALMLYQVSYAAVSKAITTISGGYDPVTNTIKPVLNNNTVNYYPQMDNKIYMYSPFGK